VPDNQNKKIKEFSIREEIMDLIPDICFFVSRKGEFVKINEKAVKVFGYDEEELLSRSFYDFIDENYLSRYKKSVQTCLQTGEYRELEIVINSKNDEKRTISLTISKYPAKKIIPNPYCFIVAKDITDEKQKEIELIRFSNVAHFSINPLEITDVTGKIIYVNPAFEKASGYSKEELIGKDPNIFSSGKHPQQFWDKMWDSIKSGKVWSGEIENKRRNGDPFYTHLLISPIVNAEGITIGYFGIHTDITEQKFLQKQLLHAQKMESIGTLVAGIAHEVGNPLTSISSLVQVIQRTTTDKFTIEKLDLIKSQINRISKIIRELVDFSRKSPYQVQLTDVNSNLKEAVEIVKVGKKSKRIDFNMIMDENLPLLPLVPDQVQQVFINILINAVDAIDTRINTADKTDLPVKGKIAIATYCDTKNLYAEIVDNGHGISGEHLVKIFEPFFTTKKIGEGTGLGLWISYGIVKSFQGDIKVDSTVGEGTSFKIILPLYHDY
jgi:PAS domain S-box-containing protein